RRHLSGPAGPLRVLLRVPSGDPGRTRPGTSVRCRVGSGPAAEFRRLFTHPSGAARVTIPSLRPFEIWLGPSGAVSPRLRRGLLPGGTAHAARWPASPHARSPPRGAALVRVRGRGPHAGPLGGRGVRAPPRRAGRDHPPRHRACEHGLPPDLLPP